MEHEIIGHTKKAYKILKNPGKTVWDKVKEILVEVLIIVFAVSFAAFIERSREHAKEQAEAKEFVAGLKGDIAGEINMLQQSVKDVDTMTKSYNLVMQIKSTQIDSLERNHVKKTFNITNFYSPIINGRYDGFKSSGKIQTIENDSLRNDILQFYQEDIPNLNFAEINFNDNQKRLTDLLVSNADDKGDKQANVMEILTSTKGKLILQLSVGYSQNVRSAYIVALKHANRIEAEIDK